MITLRDVQGHWVRDWIKAPDFEDHTTRVHWIQVGEDYADVRVPLARPKLGASQCLADLDVATLLDLAQAEGFAGHVFLKENTCTWVREINWHGTPEGTDIGAISFDEIGKMIEAGVEADYTELWQNRDGAPEASFRFATAAYAGQLVVRGAEFVLAIGSRDKPNSKQALMDLNAGSVSEHVRQLFDGVHAVGEWRDGTAVARLATQPFCEGLPVASLQGDAVVWHRIAFDGLLEDVPMTCVRPDPNTQLEEGVSA